MTIRNAFWALVVGTVCLFAFFAATGAWDPAESPVAAIAVGVLCVLWAAHAYAVHRHHQEQQRDPALRHARERRGF